jgi:hypothetical protein
VTLITAHRRGEHNVEKSNELRDFVLSSYKAMLNGDFGFLSQRDDVLMIGTDANEWWTGYATLLKILTPQMEALAGSTMEGDPQAYVEGTVGWVADQVKMVLPDGTELQIRLTAVYHKEDNDWKGVQWHWSIGVPNEEAFGQEL